MILDLLVVEVILDLSVVKDMMVVLDGLVVEGLLDLLVVPGLLAVLVTLVILEARVILAVEVI